MSALKHDGLTDESNNLINTASNNGIKMKLKFSGIKNIYPPKTDMLTKIPINNIIVNSTEHARAYC